MSKTIDSLLSKTVASPNGCRIFTGCTQANGYGRVRLAGKTDYAHRHMYRLSHGEIPAGMDVCHWCDVRGCINPQHLFLGTRADNMADAVRKGRQAKGFMLPQTKLTKNQREQIAQWAAQGALMKEIAAEFGISRPHAGYVAKQQGFTRNVIR